MTDSIHRVPVPLGERSYVIEIGTGNLERVGRQLAACCPARHAIVVTDENVQHTHAELAVQSAAEQCDRIDLLVVEPGEGSKSLDTAAALLEQMLAIGADRRSVVLAVGGGVVGDLAGFVAAVYARGVPLFQVPTTLLAQVDSSVGGKVGVNLPAAKNMVGAFWQPRGVAIDTQVLSTLADRDYRAGLAEVVKYGMILDAEFFAFLEASVDDLARREPAVLRRIIARCCELKAQVVAQDEREETGLRAVLNYGHTFAHAFESLTGYETLVHGEAVAIGMLCASRLAERLGRIPADLTARQQALLEALGLPTSVPDLEEHAVLTAMQHDKKSQAGRLRFVLPTRLGHVELVEGVPAEAVASALR